MVHMSTIIYTIFSRLLLIISLLFLAIPLAICLLLPQKLLVNNRFFSYIAQFFYWFCVKFSFLPITYKGLENLPQDPCIIVANHQSSFDIPLIGYLLKDRIHVWLAWAELAKSPLFKFILPRIAILVDTSSPLRGMRTLMQAINTIKTKPWDLIIFPEGGRYTDNKVHEFFAGFALIAQKTGRPVVPIKIIGVNKVYPPFTFWIYYHPITVIIGTPMIIEEHETIEQFHKRVYTWFLQEHKEQ